MDIYELADTIGAKIEWDSGRLWPSDEQWFSRELVDCTGATVMARRILTDPETDRPARGGSIASLAWNIKGRTLIFLRPRIPGGIPVHQAFAVPSDPS